MPGQVPRLTEGAPTDLTLKRLVPRVDALKQRKELISYIECRNVENSDNTIVF